MGEVRGHVRERGEGGGKGMGEGEGEERGRGGWREGKGGVVRGGYVTVRNNKAFYLFIIFFSACW